MAGTLSGVSDESVFICGMFRTGSTLLEQVLAAHPGFVAGGESEFFPRLIAKELRDFPSGLAGITSESAYHGKKNTASRSGSFLGTLSGLPTSGLTISYISDSLKPFCHRQNSW